MEKKQKRGITIVTLVITVIILTVLTGAVMLTTNNSDIFGQTQNTVDEHNKQAIMEQIKLEIETEMIKKVNEIGRYQELSKEETINIINKYGTYEEDTLKLTTREKNIEIYLYEILDIKVEEYVTAVYKDKQFTITEKEESLSSNGYIYEYSYDNGQTWQTYTSSTTIEEQSGIKVRLVNSEGQVISNEYVVTKGAGEETVNNVKAITITKAPDKTTYVQGETFNSLGMVVTVTYEDNTSKVVTDYNYIPTRALTVSDRYVTISYTENGVTKQTTQTITVTNKLTAIGITNLAKTNYKQGEKINKEDIEVTALYEDNSTKPVTDFTYEPTEELTAENTSITVTYTEDGVEKTTSKDIQVTYITALEITSEPSVEFKTTYIKGEDFDPTGLIVSVIYADTNALPITNYKIVNGTNLQVGTSEIVIRYTEGGITLEEEIPITVTNNITGIVVTTPPNKTTYNHNEAFDKTDMVVTATYQDTTTRALQESEYTVSTPTYGQNYVTITHTETGLTTPQAVTVNRVLASIEVETPPTKTIYEYEETINTEGMVIEVTYTDGGTENIQSGYTVAGTTTTYGKRNVTITYQGMTTTQEIVVAYPTDGRYYASKGVNSPLLAEGMTAVYWNGTTEVTSANPGIDENFDYNSWYNYEAQTGATTSGGTSKWANAKTADGSYWVWIPRYAYSITSGYHTSTAGTIDIEFLQNKSSTSTVTDRTFVETLGNGYWHVHPAFYYDGTSTTGTQLAGIWVAKYEMSMETNGVTTKTSSSSIGNVSVVGNANIKAVSKPGVTAWYNVSYNNMFLNSLNYDTTSVNNASLDSHLMKNSEWGAVVYLAHSKYGRNGTKVPNNGASYTAGGSGATAHTNVLQSTTGNCYGVFDLNGGYGEAVAAYSSGMQSSSSNYSNASSLISAKSKYREVYDSSYSSTDYSKRNNARVYGDGIWETSSSCWIFSINGNEQAAWFGCYSKFVDRNYAYMARGGNKGSTVSGTFMFDTVDYIGVMTLTFRVVLWGETTN